MTRMIQKRAHRDLSHDDEDSNGSGKFPEALYFWLWKIVDNFSNLGK
jgi:hypothetical protein